MENNEYLPKLKESYAKHKDSEIAQDIALIESNGDMKKELELLKYYYEDMKHNESIKFRIVQLEGRISLNEHYSTIFNKLELMENTIKDLRADLEKSFPFYDKDFNNDKG